MNYELILRPAAEKDIEKSFNWYEDQVKGLGHRFRHQVDECLARIVGRPLGYPVVHRQFRKALLNRFPHTCYFFVNDDRIIITACVHQSRHPKVWQNRN